MSARVGHTAPVSAHSLSPQERALCHVASLSSGAPLDPTLRVTLNFHPDRPVRGRPILLALAEAGLYQSQFLTGTSNGGQTAYVGVTGGGGRAGSSEAHTTMRPSTSGPSTAP